MTQTNKIKYAVRFGTGGWKVMQGMRTLKVFKDKADAERYAQQLVEDDAWHASNR